MGAPPVVVTVPPGNAFSITAERWPKKAASSVALSPAGPEPIAIRSYSSCIANPGSLHLIERFGEGSLQA